MDAVAELFLIKGPKNSRKQPVDANYARFRFISEKKKVTLEKGNNKIQMTSQGSFSSQCL